jgi:hypothetical protein
MRKPQDQGDNDEQHGNAGPGAGLQCPADEAASRHGSSDSGRRQDPPGRREPYSIELDGRHRHHH